MKVACSHELCQAPMTGCMVEGLPLDECPHYQAALNAPSADTGAVHPPIDGERPSWSSLTFTPNAAAIVCGEGRPPLLGLVGLTGAGKTSFLATLYLLVKQRSMLEKWRFAGSFTLRAWEAISYNMHWREGEPPTYPPRTTGQGREPGMLHLALRGGEEDELRDVLVTDVPGEWFHHWVTQANDERAEGARWIAHHADAFLFFVDGGGLAGEKRHAVRRQTIMLAERLKAELRGRPVVVVWAKCDELPENQQVKDVEDALRLAFGECPAFRTISAITPHDRSGTGVSDAFAEAINLAGASTSAAPVEPLGREARLARFVRGVA